MGYIKGKGHFEPDRHFLACLKISVNVLLNQKVISLNCGDEKYCEWLHSNNWDVKQSTLYKNG